MGFGPFPLVREIFAMSPYFKIFEYTLNGIVCRIGSWTTPAPCSSMGDRKPLPTDVTSESSQSFFGLDVGRRETHTSAQRNMRFRAASMCYSASLADFVQR